MMRNSRWLLVVFGCFLATSLCLADDVSMGEAFKQFMAAPDRPVILRGDYFRATSVAYRDFSKEKGGHSQMQNYDVSIDQTPTTYIVQFGPAMKDPSEVVFGGGARYVIERTSFRILSRTFLK
jgi:hypothetical protein